LRQTNTLPQPASSRKRYSSIKKSSEEEAAPVITPEPAHIEATVTTADDREESKDDLTETSEEKYEKIGTEGDSMFKASWSDC
jgi:hypothetical protein